MNAWCYARYGAFVRSICVVDPPLHRGNHWQERKKRVPRFTLQGGNILCLHRLRRKILCNYESLIDAFYVMQSQNMPSVEENALHEIMAANRAKEEEISETLAQEMESLGKDKPARYAKNNLTVGTEIQVHGAATATVKVVPSGAGGPAKDETDSTKQAASLQAKDAVKAAASGGSAESLETLLEHSKWKKTWIPLTPTELHKICTRVVDSISHSLIKDIFALLDIRKNGKLSLRELMIALSVISPNLHMEHLRSKIHARYGNVESGLAAIFEPMGVLKSMKRKFAENAGGAAAAAARSSTRPVDPSDSQFLGVNPSSSVNLGSSMAAPLMPPPAVPGAGAPAIRVSEVEAPTASVALSAASAQQTDAVLSSIMKPKPAAGLSSTGVFRAGASAAGLASATARNTRSVGLPDHEMSMRDLVYSSDDRNWNMMFRKLCTECK